MRIFACSCMTSGGEEEKVDDDDDSPDDEDRAAKKGVILLLFPFPSFPFLQCRLFTLGGWLEAGGGGGRKVALGCRLGVPTPPK